MSGDMSGALQVSFRASQTYPLPLPDISLAPPTHIACLAWADPRAARHILCLARYNICLGASGHMSGRADGGRVGEAETAPDMQPDICKLPDN